jgi:isocitrate/isopropylmalate dehydrogenase
MPYCTTQVRCRAHQPHRVVLIPGDGIGPEVAEATARAVEATGISLQWERVELNGKTIAKCGGLVPSAVLEAMGHIRVGLKGPVSTPVGAGFQSVNLALRKKLNLFANFRPVSSLPGLKTRVIRMLALTSPFSERIQRASILGSNTKSCRASWRASR